MKPVRVVALCVVLVFAFCNLAGQQAAPAASAKPDIYNPDLNAKIAISDAVAKAKAENKHVLMMFGANWCQWCHRLHELLNGNKAIKAVLDKKFVFVLIDIGEKKDKLINVDLQKLYRINDFGYPALVVLNGEGELMCAQSSGTLEKGQGHDADKVLSFLKAEAPQGK
jgi:thioredoxin-related protein